MSCNAHSCCASSVSTFLSCEASVRRNHFLRSLSALPGSASGGEIHPSVVWRKLGSLDHVHALLSSPPPRRLSVFAPHLHSTGKETTSHRTFGCARGFTRGYRSGSHVLENTHPAGSCVETNFPGSSGGADPVTPGCGRGPSVPSVEHYGAVDAKLVRNGIARQFSLPPLRLVQPRLTARTCHLSFRR